MRNTTFVTENELDEWVRAHAEKAQGLIVNLIANLVIAAIPQPIDRRFPLDDSISQPGADGYLETDSPFQPFIPIGKSYWEIGSGNDAAAKANKDYNELTHNTPLDERQAATFVFVTPLSGRRGWKATWGEAQQRNWLTKKRSAGDWKDVQVIDGARIIDWLRYFPSVDRWLAVSMGKHGEEFETLAERWALIRTIGEPPPLTPDLFLSNRGNVITKLDELLSRGSLQLRIQTRFPLQITDLVAAYAESRKEELLETEHRCLIVKSIRALSEIVQLGVAHFIIIDFPIDSEDEAAVRLLQIAKNKGHGLIYAVAPGGVPHANQVLLYDPTAHQMQETLEKSGYTRERARCLTIKSGDSLRTLLLCLQNLSLAPEWTQGTDAAELAIAALLGSWNENNKNDRAVAEQVSGKAYGEWIAVVSRAASKANTPLVTEGSNWSLVSRYEAWHALGRYIDQPTLNRLRSTAINVFTVRDRQFDVDTSERYKQSWNSQEALCSRRLRRNLAETLALIRNHSSALTLCEATFCRRIADETIAKILESADWKLWATLDEFLPLFAEASPRAVLIYIERHLSAESQTFGHLFDQELGGCIGREYISGTLWALETVAWETEYFVESVLLLGELASKDPGGEWANRPLNSLRQIFLPWMPQTTADAALRSTAITALRREQEDVCWQLLIELLPVTGDTTSGTRKPRWRSSIPEDFREFPSYIERYSQEVFHATLVVEMALDSNVRLESMIPKIATIPRAVRSRVLEHLKKWASEETDIEAKVRIWTDLERLARHHRRYPKSDWALSNAEIQEIESVVTALAPNDKLALYQRLFSEREHDLFENRDDYPEQVKLLEAKRQAVLSEIVEAKGVGGVLDFVRRVEAPWRVGYSCSHIDLEVSTISSILNLLLSDDINLQRFVGAFIQGQFNKLGWTWIDQLPIRHWRIEKRGRLFSYLPFGPDTWERVSLSLGKRDAIYWQNAEVNPYRVEGDLQFGILRLVKYGRTLAALSCLERDTYQGRELNVNVAMKVLDSLSDSEEPLNNVHAHSVIEVIKALQNLKDVPEDSLQCIEWKFLPILSSYGDHRALTLEKRLAKDPSFFVDVLKIIYHPENSDSKEPQDDAAKAYAENAFRLYWNWSYPPGLKNDGMFDEQAFLDWLSGATEIARNENRYTFALEKIGHVLRYVPINEDGFWLPKSVAEVLDRKDSELMRDGFRIEWINSRGAYWGTQGREESKLSDRFMQYAESSDREGYPRLARTMRELSKFYADEASGSLMGALD